MRFGFCCKYIDSVKQLSAIKTSDNCYQYNCGTTTVAAMNKLSRSLAYDKLFSLIRRNVSSIRKLIKLVGSDIPEKRMVRLSSEILPLYTHPDYVWFYQLPDVIAFLEKQFSEIGYIARSTDTRLSFHPGQFTVLSSHRPEIVDRSILEFEYHCDIIRWMGFGSSFQDMKNNVHLSGKGGAEVFRKVYPRLSKEARNTITIENDEFSSSLSDCLAVSDLVPIVFDIHHEWINSGEFLTVDNSKIKTVIDSWRGIRPVMHYSQSQETLLTEHSTNTLPDINKLLESGFKKTKLRAHSDFYWNRSLNQLVGSFAEYFDIQCECKSKNLGRDLLYKELYEKI